MTEITENIDFQSLNLPIPSIVYTYPIEKQRTIFQYLNELDDINKKGYTIAFSHLESSFDICRSNGYKSWEKANKQ